MKTNGKIIHNKFVIMGLSALAVLLMVLLVSPFITRASVTYYENNFDEETAEGFLKDWTVSLGKGSATIEDKSLMLSTTGNALTALTYNNTLPGSNYVVEFDFSFNSSESETRWGGFVVRYTEGEGLWHASLRKNGNLNVDYYNSVSNSYPVVNSFTRAEGDIDAPVRVRIVLVDNVLAYYVNGIYVAHTEISDGGAGKVGFACSGSSIKIDNLKITSAVESDLPTFKSTDVYIPKTGYVNAPVVVATPSTLAEATYAVDKERPSVAMLTVDSELNALGDGVSYGKADQLANSWQTGVIPAFRVADEGSANAAAKFFAEGHYVDSFIVVDSKDAALLKQARSVAVYSRGVIDFSDRSDITVEQIAETVYENSASVAIVPADFSTENINRLRTRLVTVWKYAENGSYFSALYSGVNGIVTAEYSELYDIYGAQKEKVVTRKALVSGHRGTASYPENTLNGFIKAYEMGVDMFELDLYVSSDGHIVIHHDSTVTRTTNGSGKIESMTLEQIKALTIDTHSGISETIPTLKEVYETFKGKDVVLQVEFKSKRDDLVPKLEELTKECDMMSQVAFFPATFAQAAQLRDYMPEAPAALFVGEGYGYGSDYEQLQMQTAVYNLQCSKRDNSLTNFEYTYNLAARGISSFVHTITSRSVFDDCSLVAGVDCILTDYPEWGSDTSRIYELTPVVETVELGSDFTPKGKINGTYKVVSCGIERTDGKAIEPNNDGTYCITEETEVVYYYDVSRVIDHGSHKEKMQYRIYSGPVVIK